MASDLRPPSSTIYGLATFQDDQGRTILSKTAVIRDGAEVHIMETMEAVPVFIGQGAMSVTGMDGKISQIPFQFHIEAASLAEAFLRYETAGEAGMRNEIERQRLASLRVIR